MCVTTGKPRGVAGRRPAVLLLGGVALLPPAPAWFESLRHEVWP